MTQMQDIFAVLSDDELRAELDRREKLRKEAARPKPLAAACMPRVFTPLIGTCEKYIEHCDDAMQVNHDRSQHKIFRHAMECIYGEKFWEWHDEKI